MKPNLSRRQFLAHSAGIASASLGLGMSRPGVDGGAAELRLGFIGLGDRGRQLLGAVLACARSGEGPRVRVAGLCDVHPKHLERALDLFRDGAEAGGRPRGFSNYRALLDEKDVDAVIIATPVHLHAPQSITSLAAGKHVYCEKPMGLEPGECREVLLAARRAEKSGRVFQTGFQRRYSPRYRASMRFVHSGEAGRLLFVRAQWHATGNLPKDKPWIFRREKSGGAAVEQACHQFDIFNWLFQAPPVRACGFGGLDRFRDEPPGRDTMDHYGTVIEYPGGIKVQLSHLSFAIPDRRFSGIYELAFAERMGIDLSNAVVWPEGGATRQLVADGSPLGSQSDTQLAVRSFFDAAGAGRVPEAEAGAEAAYRATLAALLCQRALDSGQVAHWKEIEPSGTSA